MALWGCLAIFAGSLALSAAPARALITPATTIDGPSPSIIGVGNVAMASDGTGGVVWRKLSGGVSHIFVSQYIEGSWSAPIPVDAGPGPGTFPAIAAGDGGELLVVWVAPWASESIGGQAPMTRYQLFSSLMQPGSQAFGPPVQVDPTDVGDGTGVYPSLAMAPNGTAYIAYRVVTNALSPNVPQALGTIAPMRPGDELVDVRVARFNGLSWSSLGQVNRLPGQVTLRKPTATNAPVIAVDPTGDALVAWQEPSIDGVARLWARRLFKTTLGNVLPVSPQTLGAQPVGVDADALALSLSKSAGAKIAFRLAGGAGSPLSTPHILVNTLAPAFDTNGGAFSGPVAIAGGSTVGAPSVAVDDNGNYQAGFTVAGVTEVVSGRFDSAQAPQSLGPAAGDPALATLDPDGGSTAVWPGADSAGRQVVRVRETFLGGSWQSASLSAPITGPVSSLTVGPSGQGDALIAFEQGLGSTSQVAVAAVQAPPHPFTVNAPAGWVTAGRAMVRWDQAGNTIGTVRYSILVDGQVRARGIYVPRYRLRARALGDGVHHVRVVAIDSAGQETMYGPVDLKVDANPPLVRVRRLPRRRVQIRVTDRGSGAASGSTLVSFGDGGARIRNALTVVHSYRRPGRYLITVRCADFVGHRAVDHLWVQVG